MQSLKITRSGDERIKTKTRILKPLFKTNTAKRKVHIFNNTIVLIKRYQKAGKSRSTLYVKVP